MKRKFVFLIGVIFATLFIVTIAIAAVISTSDNTFNDWLTPTPPAPIQHIDNAVDDYSVNNNADITEFRLAPQGTNNLAVLVAFDNTNLQGGNTTFGVLRVRRSDNGNYYYMYFDASNAANISIYNCGTTPTCPGTPQCSSTSNCGATARKGENWPDPFTHGNSKCSGSSCNTLDTAIEALIPWTQLGGVPSGSTWLFFNYFSAASAGSMTAIDGGVAGTEDPNGISCKPATPPETGYTCYEAYGPTNLGITDFTGAAQSVPPLAWGALGLAVVGLALVGSGRLIKPRTR